MKYSLLAVTILAGALSIGLAPEGFAQGSNPAGTVGYTGTDVGEVVKRLEKTADAFTDRFDDSLDKSILDDTALEGRLNKWAEDLEDAIDEVKDEYQDGDAVRPHLAEALRIANQINDEVLLREVGPEAEADWANIRADLNTLARVYGQMPIRER